MAKRPIHIVSSKSLRGTLISHMMILLPPILIILLICTMAMAKSFESLIQDHVAQTISPFAAELDSVFSSAMRYIANIDIDLSFMDVSRQEDELAVMNTIRALSADISEDLSTYTDIDAVFLYHDSELWFVQNYDRSYAQNQEASENLKDMLLARQDDTPVFQEGFQEFSAGGIWYFFLASDMQNGIYGCWFNQSLLLDKVRSANLDGLEDVVFRSSGTESTEWDTSEYFVTEYALTSIPYSIVTVWDREIIFSAYYSQLSVTVLCIVVAYLLFVIFVFSLHRSVLRPLARMVQVIRSFHHTEPGPIPVDPKEPVEVREVFDAMNTMICDLKDLKIQVYEEQLMKQKAEMQLYQMQLRPHFFLNALNSIITFAQEGDCGRVEKLGMCLAVHFKYLLYHTWYVFLEEELHYTRYYVQMQNIQDNLNCCYEEKVTEEALDYEIPILCVQTFVENAIKYGRDEKNAVTVTVSASVCEQEAEPHLRVTIDDTGNGFSEEILEELQKEKWEFQEHGVGIANVKKRLSLLYGDRACLRFSNNNRGGAHIELLLPMLLKQKEVTPVK